MLASGCEEAVLFRGDRDGCGDSCVAMFIVGWIRGIMEDLGAVRSTS